MTGVYQFIYEDQKILLLIEKWDIYFFSGKILYPYPNVQFDYYTDERTFYPASFLKYLSAFITNIHLTLEDVNKNLIQVKSISAKFCGYKRRISNGREIIRETIVEPLVTDTVASTKLQHAGKTFKTSLTDVLCDHLMEAGSAESIRSREDYQQIFDRTLCSYKYIQNLNGGEGWSIYPPLYERFLNEMGEICTGFKILKPFNFKLRIPEQYLKKCDFEEFTTPTPGQLPLFIAMQFGIHPRLDEQHLAQLEGQKVVQLTKSVFSGYEHSLELMEISNGKFKSIKKIEHEKLD